MDRAKIAISYMGGKVGALEEALSTKKSFATWLSGHVSLRLLADVELLAWDTGTDMQRYVEVARLMVEAKDAWAFVVVVPLADVPFAGALLSYLLADAGRSVVLVATDAPGMAPAMQMGFEIDLVNAVQFGVGDHAGVYVASQHQVLHAARVRIAEISGHLHLVDPAHQAVAQIDYGVEVLEKLPQRTNVIGKMIGGFIPERVVWRLGDAAQQIVQDENKLCVVESVGQVGGSVAHVGLYDPVEQLFWLPTNVAKEPLQITRESLYAKLGWACALGSTQQQKWELVAKPRSSEFFPKP